MKGPLIPSPTSEFPTRRSRSGDKKGVIDNCLGKAHGGSDCNRSVEPTVGLRSGLEAEGDTEVVAAWLHPLAPSQGGDHLRRPMANATGGDEDRRAIIGLEGVAGIDSGHPVGLYQLPVGATWEHSAVEPGPPEPTANDGDDPALAGAHLPHL